MVGNGSNHPYLEQSGRGESNLRFNLITQKYLFTGSWRALHFYSPFMSWSYALAMVDLSPLAPLPSAVAGGNTFELVNAQDILLLVNFASVTFAFETWTMRLVELFGIEWASAVSHKGCAVGNVVERNELELDNFTSGIVDSNLKRFPNAPYGVVIPDCNALYLLDRNSRIAPQWLGYSILSILMIVCFAIWSSASFHSWPLVRLRRSTTS